MTTLAVLSLISLLVAGLSGGIGFWVGTVYGARTHRQLTERLQAAGFAPHDGGWAREVEGVPIFLVATTQQTQLMWVMVDPMPFVLCPPREGTASTGDRAFDAWFGVDCDSIVHWRFLGAEARELLVNLARFGKVQHEEDRLAVEVANGLGGDGLFEAATLLARAGSALHKRSWTTSVSSEGASVQARILRALLEHQPDVARHVAMTVALREEVQSPELQTELALARRDTPAVLRLLPEQVDEAGAFRLARALPPEDLSLALRTSGASGPYRMLAACSRAAWERADDVEVRQASLDALRAWLRREILDVPGVTGVGLRLLQVAHREVTDEDLDLVACLATGDGRDVVVGIGARVGTAKWVPMLLELEAQAAKGERTKIRRAIAAIQSRMTGDVGALSVPVVREAGDLAVPETEGGLSVADQPSKST